MFNFNHLGTLSCQIRIACCLLGQVFFQASLLQSYLHLCHKCSYQRSLEVSVEKNEIELLDFKQVGKIKPGIINNARFLFGRLEYRGIHQIELMFFQIGPLLWQVKVTRQYQYIYTRPITMQLHPNEQALKTQAYSTVSFRTSRLTHNVG